MRASIYLTQRLTANIIAFFGFNSLFFSPSLAPRNIFFLAETTNTYMEQSKFEPSAQLSNFESTMIIFKVLDNGVFKRE